MNDDEYQILKRKILDLIHIDLNNYKTNQMMRRLNGFIPHDKFPNIRQYCDKLDRDPGELEKLRNFITINFSEFFRDQAPFQMLRNVILPQLLQKSPRLNIWSAGCSDGQEPYSVSIILKELTPRVKHRILATDIDKENLNKAKAGGPYQYSELKNLSQPVISQYFKLTDAGYLLNEEIRDSVAFSQIDLTRDVFPQGFDLIICRNVTIYFSNEAKNILNHKFLNSLRNDGVLFIGATETMLDANEIGFQRLYSCFFKKGPVSGQNGTRIPNSPVLSRR